MFLSFLLPYPIRNTKAPFLWVFYKQLENFQPEDVLFVGSKEYFFDPLQYQEEGRWETTEDGQKRNGYTLPSLEKIASYRAYYIEPGVFDSLDNDCAACCNVAFSRLLTERYVPLEEAFQSILEACRAKGERIEAILSWCNLPSIEHVARAYRIPVIHNELGPFRMPDYVPTAYFDFSGVNGNTEAQRRYSAFAADDGVAEIYTLRDLQRLLWTASSLPELGDPAYDIGVPLQVEDDSNLMAFANGFNNMNLLCAAGRRATAEEVLVRPHPGGHFRYEAGPLGCKDTSKSAIEFLGKCREIDTINSSVGLEALLYGKKVHAFGDSPYRFLACDLQQDQEKLLQGLNFIIFGYLIPYAYLYDAAYYRWRLSSPSEIEVYRYHMKYYLKELERRQAAHEEKEWREKLESQQREIAELRQENQKVLLQNQKLHQTQQALRQSNHELQLQNRSLQTEQQKHLATLQDCRAYLQEIEGSRGYRLVKRYYHLRDRLLPRGSRKRLLVKSVAWGLIHPRVMVSLLTQENLRKAWAAWRIGGFAQLLSRADGKLHSPAVQEISCETGEETRAHNRWLAESPAAILPAGTVIDLVVPVYNAPDFTKRCLASVLANTDTDYRLIVIDDCSTDPAIAGILEDFRSRGGEGHLQEMQILRNEKNLGFIGTVNRAFSLAKHHVVLLNTDTEVPPGWLSRLVRPLFGGERIATVTPFSNSAEICSFPRMAENNDLPEGMDVAAVDAVFRRYGDTSAVEIPTGVGFAMAISQECLKTLGGFDTAFGKGYGEENDFCRRAAAAGWKNVQVRDLFIYHKHGASFATRTDASKAERLAKNLAIINQRYPGYDRMIQEYIAKDPCRAERTFLAAVIRARQGHTAGKHGVLFLNHSLGGGTQSYQDGKIKERLGEERVYSACVLADGRTLIVREHSEENALPGMEIARFDYAGMTEPMYKSLLAALLVDEIFVNHLIGFRLPEFLNWNERCGIPYRVFLHDFFCVCPRYTLLNGAGEYCGAETDEAVCARCLAESDSATQDIHTWRESMQRFLAAAADVSAPSRSTAEIVERYYEDLTVEVKEHRLPAPVHPTYQASFREDAVRTVAVLGSIGPAKGVEIVYALKRRIEKENAPIRLVVIGYTSLQNEAYRDPSGKFEITGPYRPEMISDLLAKYRVNLVLIPSICPETFSYTTSEAIASGYPVAAFDLGAPAERIKRLQAGWVVPLESGAEGMWRKICEAVG